MSHKSPRWVPIRDMGTRDSMHIEGRRGARLLHMLAVVAAAGVVLGCRGRTPVQGETSGAAGKFAGGAGRAGGGTTGSSAGSGGAGTSGAPGGAGGTGVVVVDPAVSAQWQ